MNKKLNRRITCGLSLLTVSPILVNAVGITETIKVEARGSIRNTGRSLTPPPPAPRYRLSTGDKILGGISLGVAGVGLVGTAVGLGLTQTQYNQTEKTYHDVIERTYESFYEEKERYFEKLFNSWGVPMPDKYKNPMKKEEPKPTPGFDFGG